MIGLDKTKDCVGQGTRQLDKTWYYSLLPVSEAGAEHVLAPALEDGRLAGDEVVGGEHLQAAASQGHVTPGGGVQSSENKDLRGSLEMFIKDVLCEGRGLNISVRQTYFTNIC